LNLVACERRGVGLSESAAGATPEDQPLVQFQGMIAKTNARR
jgi:hypothetical protein